MMKIQLWMIRCLAGLLAVIPILSCGEDGGTVIPPDRRAVIDPAEPEMDPAPADVPLFSTGLQ